MGKNKFNFLGYREALNLLRILMFIIFLLRTWFPVSILKVVFISIIGLSFFFENTGSFAVPRLHYQYHTYRSSFIRVVVSSRRLPICQAL